MRVIAGRLGGRRLRAPSGRAVRPTSDRVREALYAMLGDVRDARVLDLFAGSGALGIEALSRGAESAVFVDSAAAALEVVRANLAALDLGPPQAIVREREARAALEAAAKRAERFDLVLIDPPYDDAVQAVAALADILPSVLASAARVVLESDRRARPSLDLPLRTERRYGDTLIQIHQIDQTGHQ